MSVLNENQLLGAPASTSQYQVSRSLRFSSADSSFLSRTPGTAGNRKTWTWSGWVKRSGLSSFQRIFQGGNECSLRFEDDNTLRFSNYTGTFTAYLKTTAVYRDASAWYHIVLAIDTTNATSTDRLRIYVNGDRVTSFSSTTYPAQNLDLEINTTTAHYVSSTGFSEYLSGYLAEIHFIDGQALTPSSFGETDSVTGEWIPKQYTGSYGTNGFRLPFSNNASTTTISQDSSGNNNHLTANNISVTAGAGNDSLVDSPTSYGSDTGVGGEVRGNYCTWNPLDGDTTLANGNLDSSGGAAYYSRRSTMELSGGKWYAEFTINSQLTGTSTPRIGIVDSTSTATLTYGARLFTSTSSGFAGKIDQAGVTILVTETVTPFNNGDIVNVAYDGTSGKLWFGKNGTWFYSGNPGAGTGHVAVLDTARRLFFHEMDYSSGASANWGARPFAYTAPSGFKALCDTSLPTPTIVRPSTAFDVVTYTGNDTTQSLTTNFSPDMVWIKSRSNNQSHQLFDNVRGAGNSLIPNLTNAEATNSAYGYLSAFNSNGFTVAAGGTGADFVNKSTWTYVAWAWDAGSSTVTNNAGSISAQVRANASAGFSIVSYTGNGTAGATVGHGLGVKPSLLIFKNRDRVEQWSTYHSSVGATKWLGLNLTDAATTSSTFLNNTEPTSTLITLGNWLAVNANTEKIVCYAFAPVAGYSAFGSYTGNGSADGPFVYTGFRPRWVMFKRATTAGGGWSLIDSARNTYNLADLRVAANLSGAEGVQSSVNEPIDILSNGFKMRGSGTDGNQTNETFIYAAFAEFPFQYARAR